MLIEHLDYIKIVADEGFFLTNNNGTYGVSIILGENDFPENYEELPLSMWPEPEPEPEPQETDENLLTEAKFIKLNLINTYDLSNSVNGFYYNGQFMWLDRETRASLKNTIESLTLMGRDSLNIWYGDTYVTLDLTSARQLLAALEVYATDCYNVTASHKSIIQQMDNINDVENFDITADYPPMLHFGITE